MQAMNDGGRHACARGRQPEVLGSQLGEIVEQRRQVGATEWISAADEKRTWTTADGVRRPEDVARREVLVSRRTGSPRQSGRTANQRYPQIDTSGRGCRDGARPACFARRRRV
jgi:hypothetical protein